MRLVHLVALLLATATLVAYWPVRNCLFVNYDDHRYVFNNEHVRAGLTRAGAWWALTTTFNVNWHPLTWLSLQLDYEIYHLNPAGYHVTNLLLHTANALLLFWVLRRMTGRMWPSAAVAAFFALHPLHVESVAWVSERKDVLSTFFWMLTLWTYTRYVERPGVLRYAWAALALGLGLMAKPMLVTLPFVLLLLDFWPLQRVRGKKEQKLNGLSQPPEGRSWRYLLVEKLPLFLLAAGSCGMTLYAQTTGSAVRSLSDLPLEGRTANAVLAYGEYLAKMFWPRNLAVFYPYVERSWTDWRVLATAGLLVIITFVAVRERHARPYLLVGWLWYLGTLVPVIGLVQVGAQALADRYTYVPLTGLFIMLAWAGAEVAERGKILARVVATTAAVLLVACAALTWFQLAYWQNSVALWQHTIRVTGPNTYAHYSLAIADRDLDRLDDAVGEFKAALRIEPDDDRCRRQLCLVLSKQGRAEEALFYFRQVLSVRVDEATANLQFAAFLIREHRGEEAQRHLAAAARLDPRLLNSATFQAAQHAADQAR